VASDQQQASDQADQERDAQQQDDRPLTPKPAVTDEHRKIAKEMRKEYDEDRPTVVMPGSDRTVTGTAVGDWLDEDGNPKYSDQSAGESKGERGTESAS